MRRGSRTVGAWLGYWLAFAARRAALVLYILTGIAAALLVICVGFKLLEGLHNFLVSPMGLKDWPPTGLAALADAMEWPLFAAMLILWAISWAVDRISGQD